MAEDIVGKIEDFFARPVVAGIKLTGTLKVGDKIRIKGHTTDLTQTVHSMQLEHEPIEVAKPGQDIGIQVSDHVREHDVVFKVTPE